VVALDSNILIYAHRREYPDHARAGRAIAEATAGARWALPWPVAHEFVRNVTDGRIYASPTPLADALAIIGALLAMPGAHAIGETPDHWERLAPLAMQGGTVAARIHDARIAAICLAHGVSELLTADRDFGRFPKLRTRNPLVG